MISAYPACFFKEDNGYSVIFPDLNYLSTCGNSLDEALSMSVDCLAGHLYFLLQSGDAAPFPSDLSCIDAYHVAQELGFTSQEAFTNLVTVDVLEYAKIHFEKSVKKTLSIPMWLNKAALEQNINFSQVLQDALKAKLHIIK